MAPVYTFTGDVPHILLGLVQGVNAVHTPAAGNGEVPEGATITAAPGDQVDTKNLDYPSFFLHDNATGASTVTVNEAPRVEDPAPAPVPAPTPVVAQPAPAPVPAPAPAPVSAPVEPVPAPAPTF